ncbi:MAG: signal peptidase I [Actinomycetota bacterium]
MTSPLTEEAFHTEWTSQGAPGSQPVRRKRFGFARELPVLIVVALSMALVIKTFLIQAFFIPSESMEPTLHGCSGCTGDRVLVNKLAYRFRNPRRGEIVVFLTGGLEKDQKQPFLQSLLRNVEESIGMSHTSDVDYIKRVIGLPGETIQIRLDSAARHQAVFITEPDGKTFELNEPYIKSYDELAPFGPFKIPPGRYFLMGDNRGNSSDSRFNDFRGSSPTGICPGPPCAVPKSRLIGKAFVRIYPFNRIKVFGLPNYPVAGLLGFWFFRRRARRSVRGKRYSRFRGARRIIGARAR